MSGGSGGCQARRRSPQTLASLRDGLHDGIFEVALDLDDLSVDHDDGGHLLFRVDPGLGGVGAVPAVTAVGDVQSGGDYWTIAEPATAGFIIRAVPAITLVRSPMALVSESPHFWIHCARFAAT